MNEDVVEARESESLSDSMRFVLEAAGIGWWDLDIVNNATTRSLLHDQLFGYSEMLPSWSYDDYLAHVHPDDRTGVAESFAIALAGGEQYALDVRVVWADGTVHWLFTRGRFLLDDDGAPRRVSGVVGDITERKLAELAAMDAEASAGRTAAEHLAMLETVLRSAPIGFAFVDLDFRFVRLNEVLAEMIAVPFAADALGCTIIEAVPELWPQVEPFLDRVRCERFPIGEVAIAYETVARPGVRREWVASFFPVQIAGTLDINGIGLIVQDVTDRLHLEAHLRQMQRLEAIGLLAGGVAHDFNNTLGVITLAAEYASERNRDDTISAELDRILAVARSTQGLTRQLIQFGRDQRPSSEFVDVRECVEAVAAFLAPTLGDHIVATLDLQSSPMVRVGRSQLEQILVNLALNARDAMAHGGELWIRTRTSTITDDPWGLRAGTYVEICVQDAGIGMSAELVEHAFEPFFTTKQAMGGSGLGLATVYGIAAAAQGDVRIESVPQVGTTIRVRLPVHDDHPSTPAVESALLPSKATRQCIMVVDDQEALRTAVERILHGAGYTVYGGTATDILARQFGPDFAPDLLVSDLVMPHISGPELARRLVERWPRLRVMHMSGYAADTVPSTGAESDWPAVRVLAKPFGSAELLSAVAGALT